MEIDRRNMVLVEEEEEEEEEEEVALRRSLRSKNSDAVLVSSSSNGETSADSETTNGIEHESPRKDVNGDGCVDSETSNVVDFDSPNKGIVQEEARSLGTESIHGAFEMKNGSMTTNSKDADVITNLVTKESLIADMNYQSRKDLDSGGFSESSLTPLEESLEEQNIKAKSFNNETKLLGDFDSLEEIDQEETELDVEGVLAKQNTHDLYCPNCNSCITRRVILRSKPKYNKVEATFSSELDVDSTNSAKVEVHETVDVHSSDSPALVASDQNNDREPEAFRCLSCFSLFIPTGDGFKLIWPFGDSSGNDNVQNLQKTSATNTNWFLSIFITDKKKMTAEQGNETLADQNGPVSSSASPSLGLVNNIESAPEQGKKEIVISSAKDKKYFENVSTNAGGTSKNTAVEVNAAGAASNSSVVDTVQEASSQCSSDTMIYQHKKDHPATLLSGIPITGETAEDASLGALQGGANSPVSSTFESLAPEQSPAEVDKNSNTVMAGKQPIQSDQASTVLEAQMPTKLLGGELPNESAVAHQETNKDTTFSSSQGIPTLKKEATGHDVIVIVETRPPDPAASQTQTAPGNDDSDETSILLQTQIYTSEQRSAGVTVDILKSIVCGGLIESITSLGVVSSAAGAGSSTLNIFALGLANLIGGLFIIGHKLIELKNDTSGGSTNQLNVREDRYQETLGRRENFPLHATVAVLSFLIFGMLSPVIYGFSFRKSDDKDLKLVVVGGVSLACILLLAIGKAHVRRTPKSYISTALYYVISGITASGISYVVGDLISKLMEKVGWFESSSAVSSIVPLRKPVELAWASY